MSTNEQNLGRLVKVGLNEVWKHEAHDFTPWLANEENLALLGDTIGLELELEAQEKNVGPFRADILCKDTASNNWVLVENQLERTDHTHLGQLLTYAAGLKAVAIVWIADRFTDEHRAALDWLNEITDDRFNFFGLEVELWRIGDSPIAPKFNIVCEPNEWTRSVSRSSDLTETQALQLEYWTRLRALLEQRGGVVRPTKPQPQNWLDFSIGRGDFWLEAFANMRDKRIGVLLITGGPNAKPHFHLLHQDRAQYESAVGTELEWAENPDKKQSYVKLRRHNCDPSSKANWPEQHDWLYENLQAFHKAFSRSIKQLNAEDYRPPDDES